ncbi:protein dalmatian [Contarinia nasturtii]|uniref:protein dalmatian n=1 Tax=Contarinia nasturtii TaxID=265458 RepID=UPI0012D430EC|nr:protein dalmatian [Contarinia nasturtii]
MGRKAKEAATKKIGEWTNSRRNMSKTTTKNENTNASNESRTPLQTQSQSDLNAMKNCSVRLEKIRMDPKITDTVIKTPVKKIPATHVMTKDKAAKQQNVYDYSFDGEDTPGPMKEIEDQMKDLFDKLAKDNIIEVKKYRPKNVKKTKTDEKNPVKKAVTQKRRRDKQPVDVEPPQKKPNLKRKVVNVPIKSTANPTVVPSKGSGDDVRGQVNAINTVNAKLRNPNLQRLQSTPKTSTPLGTKANAMGKQNNGSLNSIFFENASPLVGRSTRGNIQKQRLQLSAINDSQENVPKTGQNEDNENVPQYNYNDDNDFDVGNNGVNEPDHDVDKENSLDRPSTSAQSRPTNSSVASHLWDQPSTSAAALRSLDKPANSASIDKNQPGTSSGILRSLDRPTTSSASTSNEWDQPSTSAAALRLLDKPGKSASIDKNQPGTSSGILRPLNRPSTSSASTSNGWYQPSISAQAARTPLKNSNDNSVFEISSEYNIFSPTKRRVYGRSPLKNITSEVNNTNSPSFESVKSTTSAARSFGVLPKSTLNSIQTSVNSTKDSSVTLPEASYFSSRRAAQVFDRNVDSHSFADDCFGFDDDDEEEIINETTNKESECAKTTTNTTAGSKSEAEKSALDEIRAKLKRFLHKPDVDKDESIKKTKVTSKQATADKTKAKHVRSPAKSPAKVVKSPVKQKRNVVFGDTGAIQKDIRTAFAVKPSDKRKKDNSKDPVTLFEEVDTVQDRRRSYSRPQRQRKRRISIESEESEEEEHSDDEDFDDIGKPSKRAKRRKKTTEPNPKELEELEDFARQTNEHFDEIDSFELVVE